ncbi:hypothetical protein K1T71_012649 [Dendrolimus kikuchii]|uniref:Uncharacterized protein n=1 Tax=Dendrolimus kikuchii TaxID=765133 RepID=A0ACC1CJX7_9NEOP|nr:hypothetical protein K1T71_012649 [Dendrolimus kikuchii]
MGENDHKPPARSEKSTRIIKKPQQSLKIGTFNVRSLTTTKRFIKLTHMLQKMKIDILGMAEVRRMGYAIEEHEEYIFCYKEHKTNIVCFTAFTDRVALLKMKYNNQLLAIIQVYAPTEKATDEEINLFYKTLQVAQSQAGDNVFVIGDFNAKVGQHETEDSENFLEYKLTNMNSFFKARKNRKWTWLSPCGNIKNEIDFILSIHPTRITNVEVLNGFGFGSDHRLVRATYMLDQRKKSRTSFKSQPKPLSTDGDISSYLKNLEITLTLRYILTGNKARRKYSNFLQ